MRKEPVMVGGWIGTPPDSAWSETPEKIVRAHDAMREAEVARQYIADIAAGTTSHKQRRDQLRERLACAQSSIANAARETAKKVTEQGWARYGSITPVFIGYKTITVQTWFKTRTHIVPSIEDRATIALGLDLHDPTPHSDPMRRNRVDQTLLLGSDGRLYCAEQYDVGVDEHGRTVYAHCDILATETRGRHWVDVTWTPGEEPKRNVNDVSRETRHIMAAERAIDIQHDALIATLNLLLDL